MKKIAVLSVLFVFMLSFTAPLYVSAQEPAKKECPKKKECDKKEKKDCKKEEKKECCKKAEEKK
ncbi:MAG: hypothetical protein JXB17_05140 [Bacteroidales bacterium]|nr:hypothetical protein [Bacteroidales bacterium]